MRPALSIFFGGLALFLAIVTLIVLYRLFTLLVILTLGLMLAQAIDPAVQRMESRHVPRAVGVLLIYALVATVLVSAGWIIIPPIAGELGALLLRLPDFADDVLLFITPWRELLERFELIENVREAIREILAGIAQNLISFLTLPLLVFDLIVNLFMVFVFAFLFSVNGSRMEDFLLRLVHPDRREDARGVMHKMGANVRSELLLMTAVGLLTWGGLLVLGMPYAHLLAVLAFLTEAIPMVGPFLGGIPAVLVAAFISPILAIQVVVLYVLVQQVENYLLVPLIHGSQLRVSPFLVILSILVGGGLFGFAGVLIAVPVTAALQVLVEDVIVPWRERQLGGGAPAERGEQPPDAPGAEEREGSSHDG